MSEFPKVLVADDSQTIQKAVRLALDSYNYEVRSAHSGKEALALAQKWHPDIIIADTKMPEGNGFFLSKAIKASSSLKSTKVILLHGPLEEIESEKLAECSADKSLMKPFDVSSLTLVLEGFSQKEKTPTPPVSSEKDITWDIQNMSSIDIDQEILKLGSEEIPQEPISKVPEQPQETITPPKQEKQETVEKMTKEVIEKIAWEVVPRLSEKIIREEIEKLLKKTPLK